MLLEKIKKALAEPHEAGRVVRATCLGLIVKHWYRMTNPQVEIGKKFRAYSWLKIKGPGKVVIGDNVSAEESFLRLPCIRTYLSESMVTIGRGSYLGGIRIGCVDKIAIGEEALLGSATILDSDVIPHRGVKVDDAWKKRHVKPVSIGAHFWAGTNSFILKGATILEECVLGAGSVITMKDVPEKSLLVGNPVRKIGVTRND